MNTFDLFKLPLYWEMVNAEKIALLNVLNDVKPEISIEIGTKEGGSLQLISALSKSVYSLDIDPGVKNLSNTFSNVNFIIGDSKETLPALIKKLTSNAQQPDFILVDGEHSLKGVKSDIEHILKIEIIKPLIVLMHDSFNPDCRRGMLEVDYAHNPFVESVDIDFIQGIYSPSEKTRDEMWGGFGMIQLNPNPKRENLQVKQSGAYSYGRLYNLSRHLHLKANSLPARIKSYIFRKMFTYQ
jgi:hypothetical protein